MSCDHTGFCPYCGPERDRLVKVIQIAYTILADVRHQWAGRHTAEGQGALVAMREAIAKATGRDPQDVQDEAQAVK